MSALGGEVTVIKTEVDSEGELEIAEESSDESDEPINAQVVMTTNFHDTRLPMLEDFKGPYNFSYKLPENGQSSIKPTWEYSKIFNQVFIKMDRVLIVQFAFDTEKVNINDLYIRAVLVYSSADHIFAPVNRCAVHAIEEDPLSKSHSDRNTCLCPFYELAGHVVRCKSTEAMYCYDPKSERHSVLCPVKTTSDLLYSFRFPTPTARNRTPQSSREWVDRGQQLIDQADVLKQQSNRQVGQIVLLEQWVVLLHMCKVVWFNRGRLAGTNLIPITKLV